MEKLNKYAKDMAKKIIDDCDSTIEAFCVSAMIYQYLSGSITLANAKQTKE